MLSIGSLCTGYAGLELALARIFGPMEMVFVSDIEEASSALLAHRFPAVPNVGDLTVKSWAGWVDVLTAGFPCQPISVAGRRLGVADERWIWPEVARAVRELRPRLVVLENVAAILGRGLDSVCGSLAEIGYDIRWTCLRASDVGAPHRRERWFAIAYPGRWGVQYGRVFGVVGGEKGPEQGEGDQRERAGDTAGDRGAVAADAGGAGLQGDSGGGHADGEFAEGDRHADWGVHVGAIRRWERIVGRSAPAPTVPGRSRGRLNPELPEWMMGLPAGWITGVPGLSYKDQLHLAGNGVVPLQAEYAVRSLLASAR